MSIAPDVMEGLLAGNAAPDTAELLAQLGEDDPRMAALCRFLVQRQADAAAPATEPAPGAIADADDADALSRLEARHARLRDIARTMQRELHALRDHNAMAAAALGACDACWGRDPGCAQCEGRGRAGFDAPDPPLYARLVAPAVRRLMRQRNPNHPRAPLAPAPDRAADGPAAGPLA